MDSESRESWARRLSPLRLDAEPLREQLAVRRAAFRGLAAITTAIALGILGLFAAFERWDVGLAAATSLWLPIVGLAWRDLTRLTHALAEYEREAAE